MKASHESTELQTAIDKCAAIDKKIASASNVDFSLPDVNGKTWKLTSLSGKVAVVNFWATWCPPCRKEIPDLLALSKQFAGQGLVVLGITAEKPDVVKKWLVTHPIGYPILIDDGAKVNKLFEVEGIPFTAIYGRDGKLASVAIDMRTR